MNTYFWKNIYFLLSRIKPYIIHVFHCRIENINTDSDLLFCVIFLENLKNTYLHIFILCISGTRTGKFIKNKLNIVNYMIRV